MKHYMGSRLQIQAVELESYESVKQAKASVHSDTTLLKLYQFKNKWKYG